MASACCLYSSRFMEGETTNQTTINGYKNEIPVLDKVCLFNDKKSQGMSYSFVKNIYEKTGIIMHKKSNFDIIPSNTRL